MDSKKVISRKKFYPSIEKMLAGARFDLMVNTTDIESLATGIEPLIAVDHSLHVLEIIEAARKSQEEGRRIQLQSTFKMFLWG